MMMYFFKMQERSHRSTTAGTMQMKSKALLTALVNYEARIVSCQYDGFLCCSWSVVL